MLQADLAEKEMYIRVLQHHSSSSSSLSLSRANSISNLIMHPLTDHFDGKTYYMTSSSMPASNMTSRQSSQIDGGTFCDGEDLGRLLLHKKSSRFDFLKIYLSD